MLGLNTWETIGKFLPFASILFAITLCTILFYIFKDRNK